MLIRRRSLKRAHEAPLSIFNKVQKLTDIDYALVHLFKENREYYDVFEQAVADQREVILDNSIFELGTAFNGEEYYGWISRLQPTWYIVPDALEDKDKTIQQFDDWMSDYGESLPPWIKVIGVVQGKSYDEIVECYNYMQQNADMIAISFDYGFYEEMFPDEPTKYHSWTRGRQEVIVRMMEEGIIDQNKPHHLLGCGLPQEFLVYQNMPWIYSVDTSNPVVHGLLGKRYDRVTGLQDKESVKLFTLIEEDVVDKWDDIQYNIKMFDNFCNG